MTEENVMKRFILGSLVLVIIGLAAGIAQADFIPQPVKWSQRPDMDISSAGYKRSEHPEAWTGQMVADDWMCNDPDPVVAVRWWGMYLNANAAPTDGDGDGIPDSRYLNFEIVFHSDDPLVQNPDGSWSPNSQGYTYSTPLNMLTGYDIVSAQESYYGTVPDGPTDPGWIVYEYNAWLEVPFEQEHGSPARMPMSLTRYRIIGIA